MNSAVQILKAVETRLKAAVGTFAQVTRNQTRPLQTTKPIIDISMGGSDPSYNTIGLTDWDFEIFTDLIFLDVGKNNEDFDEKALYLREIVHKALLDQSVPPLGLDFVIRIDSDGMSEPDYDTDGTRVFAVVTLKWVVSYRTSTNEI